MNILKRALPILCAMALLSFILIGCSQSQNSDADGTTATKENLQQNNIPEFESETATKTDEAQDPSVSPFESETSDTAKAEKETTSDAVSEAEADTQSETELSSDVDLPKINFSNSPIYPKNN